MEPDPGAVCGLIVALGRWRQEDTRSRSRLGSQTEFSVSLGYIAPPSQIERSIHRLTEIAPANKGMMVDRETIMQGWNIS